MAHVFAGRRGTPVARLLSHSACAPWRGAVRAMRLKGRIALITGASRGLGAAAARGLRPRRRALRAGRPHGRRPRSGRRQDQGAGQRGRHPGAARRHRRPGHRPAGRARSTSASASSTCCSAMPACSAALADRPHRARDLRTRDGGQRHRQLAPDPLARSAAAPIRRRPRDLRDLGRQPRASIPYWSPTPPARPRST